MRRSARSSTRVAGGVTVFSVIDNIGKGAAGQALQNLNLMAGLARGRGTALSEIKLLREDWLGLPAELERLAVGSVATPSGFVASGVAWA